MKEAKPSLENSFKGTSTYHILTKGFLGGIWSDRIAPMEINHYKSEVGQISTHKGKILNQSELFQCFKHFDLFQVYYH